MAAGWIAGASIVALLLRALEIVLFGFDILAEEDWSRLLDLVASGNYTFFASWRSMAWPVVSVAGLFGLAAAAYGTGCGAALIHDRVVDLAAARTDDAAEDPRRRLPWHVRHPRLHVFLASLGFVDRPYSNLVPARQPSRLPPDRATPLPGAASAEVVRESGQRLASESVPAQAEETDHRSRPPRPWSKRGSTSRRDASAESPGGSAVIGADRGGDQQTAPAGSGVPASPEAEDDIVAGPAGSSPASHRPGPDPAWPSPPMTVEPPGLAGAAASVPAPSRDRLDAALRWVLGLAALHDHAEVDDEGYRDAVLQAAIAESSRLDPSSGEDVASVLAIIGLSTSSADEAITEEHLAAFAASVRACREAGTALPERPPAARPDFIGIWKELLGSRDDAAAAPGLAADEAPPGTDDEAEIDAMAERDLALHRALADGDLEGDAFRGSGDGASAPAEPPAPEAAPEPLAAAAGPKPAPAPVSPEAAPATRSGRGRRASVDLVAGELARARWTVFRDVGLGEAADAVPSESSLVADLVALSADRLVVVIVCGLTGGIETGGDIWEDADGEAFGPMFRARVALDEADANLASVAALRRHRRVALVVLDSCRPTSPVVADDPRIVVSQIREGAVTGQGLPTPLQALGGPAEALNRASEAMAILESRENTPVKP